MKIEINIQNSHLLIILLFITAASAIGLVAAYGGSAPLTMGHSVGEMDWSQPIQSYISERHNFPGIWLDETDQLKSSFLVLDGSLLQIQRRTHNFNEYEGTPAAIDINAPAGSLWVANTGNVGIGTNTPGTKLDVNGQINATGDICTESNGGICLTTLATEVDSLGPGLGSTVPASGGNCGGYTLLPEGYAVYNNRLAIKYGNWPCPPVDCGFNMCFYNRYYYGNGEWSDCVFYYCGYCGC